MNVMLEFDWSHFTEQDFEAMKQHIQERTPFEEPTTHGYILVGDLSVDIVSCGELDTMRDDGTMDVVLRFDLFQPIREGQSNEEDISVVEGYPYRFNDREDLNLAYNVPAEVICNDTYYDFVEQVEHTIRESAAHPTPSTENIIKDLNTETLFWQRLELQKNYPDSKVLLAERPEYKTTVIMPQGYHDATEEEDLRPVIMDDKDLVYIIQDCEKPLDRISDCGRYQAFVATPEFPLANQKGKFKNFIAQEDDFGKIMNQVQALYPELEEANTRLNRILNGSKRWEQAVSPEECFESSYKRHYLTGITADHHGPSCRAAVKDAMTKTGASFDQMRAIANQKAPMAVFESKDKYASKIIQQVQKELAAEKAAAR